jgi:hypothetical protein
MLRFYITNLCSAKFHVGSQPEGADRLPRDQESRSQAFRHLRVLPGDILECGITNLGAERHEIVS